MSTTGSDQEKVMSRADIARASGVFLHVFLLASAFPPFMSAESAWFAFVPLILVARYTKGLKRNFCWGWGAGVLFWLVNLGWLLRLAVTGGSWLAAGAAWLALSIYCGIYSGLFAALVSFLFGLWIPAADEDERASSMGGIRAQISAVVSLPLLWEGLEYLRGSLFTGFPWNALGVSQFRNEGVIQWASFGGVYCVSAIVMLANVGIAFTMLRFVDMFQRRRGPKFNLPLMLGLGGAMVLWLYGIGQGRDWNSQIPVAELRIAAVQPAVPQREKWEPELELEIINKLNSGTALASALKPDMIIWPETACPDLVNTKNGLVSGFAAAMTGGGSPILAGAIEYEIGNGATNFYNSSILYGADGDIEGVYRKMHLVPFGEYLPGETLIPALSRFAPLGFSCKPGKDMTVFRCGEKAVPFSTLICFEDIFPSLSRLAVRNGAKFLVNQTNDAWFDGSSASVQHLANAVFRCTENRVSMVRCANTGVTCFISPAGELDQTTKELLDESGRVEPEEGNRMGPVIVQLREKRSLYSRLGDWVFAAPCAAGTLLVFALAVAGPYRKNRTEKVKDLK